jgi:MFS family permease
MEVRESRDAFVEVFRNRNLRRLNGSFVGSVVGESALMVSVSVYAYREGGAALVGVLTVVQFVAMALVVPFTAALADRVGRRAVLVGSEAIRAVATIVIVGVTAADGPPMAVYVSVTVAAMSTGTIPPVRAALLPRLTNHPGELAASNVTTSLIQSVGTFVGPACGAVVLLWSDLSAVFAATSLTFVWAAVAAMRVQSFERDRSAARREGAARQFRPTGEGAGAGFRSIARSRDLRVIVGLYCAQTVASGASVVFGVAIALDLLDLGESGVGMLEALTGLGGLAGGLVALVLARGGRPARGFGVGVVLWSAPLLAVTASPTVAAAVVMMFILGVANSVVDVNASTILHRVVPDAVMGRVFGALESLVIATMALGALAMPLLITWIGIRSGLAVLGGSVAAVALLGFRALGRIDRTVLAPEGVELLRGVPILAALPPAVLEQLARSSMLVRVPAGHVVCAEGEHGDRFYVIESGNVDVTIRGEHVRSLAAGDSFGEIALLRDIPRTATVTATATADVTARALHRNRFIPAVTGHGDASDEAEAVVARLLTIR